MQVPPAVFVVALIGSLLAVMGLSRGAVGAGGTGGHAHVHVHAHHGVIHQHVHSHPPPRDPVPAEPSVPAEGAACPSHPADDHCCHDHHHGEHGCDEALPGRSREQAPTAAAVLPPTEPMRAHGALREHRQLWPHARGRPPDYLIHLRTIVMLT